MVMIIRYIIMNGEYIVMLLNFRAIININSGFNLMNGL